MEAVVRKAIAGGGEGLDFVLSDETVDRYGDVILANGWDLKNFKKNPIALFGHSSAFPIGTWSNLRVEDNKLKGTLTLAKRGTSYRLDEIAGLAEQGVLRAVSVGFIPKKWHPIDETEPYGGQVYEKQELLECSLVAVPANPAALQLAKSLHLSDDTMDLVFGGHADMRQRSISTGGHADTKTAAKPRPGSPNMKTLSQRIVDAQADLTAKKDKLVELTNADDIDNDAIEALNGEIADLERTVTNLKASEAKIGLDARATAPTVPAQPRKPLGAGQKELSGLDLLVRSIVVRGIVEFGGTGKTVDQVLEERYPGHEATAIVTKADQTIGTTTVSGWASELVQTTYADFLQALTGFSIYPALRQRGIGLNFDRTGTVSIPSRTAGGTAGGFVAEGAPIRVGRITTAATTMTQKKMGVIVAFSRELAKKSTPAIEALVRQAILEDTAATLDPLLLDNVAADTARPAGLLNGVSAVASGYGGGDYESVLADFKALLAPFFAANAADNLTVIMNPAQGLALSMMPGPDGVIGSFMGPLRERLTFVESTHATAGRLIALRNSDFATATGDTPEFDVSEQATIHMEDTTPLEIVSGTGPTTADPVRSLWQTASVGIRMIMWISWKMRRSGMVQWIDGTSW